MKQNPKKPLPTNATDDRSLGRKVESDTGASTEIAQIIHEAEASMANHFSSLRIWLLQQGYRIEHPQGETDVAFQSKAFREQQLLFSQQREQEQEQMRATMTELAQAWIQLESKQCGPAEYADSIHRELEAVPFVSIGPVLDQARDEQSFISPNEARPPFANPVDDLGVHAALVSPATAQSSQAQSMFHRLRRDLK